MSVFEHSVLVSFGDCDPAAIVFYPNFYRWTDATFHAFLQETAGGHALVCRELGARGLGLMETKLTFRSPAVPGDSLIIGIQTIEWSQRSYDVTYHAHIGERLVFEGYERRGIFVESDGRLRAADVTPLRTMLGL